nr:preprotein translocase subunit SecG [Candidatus Omnitrophota bacterium]
MYSILTVIHVIISLFLIVVILLQAGKGGGLADTFGGSQMQNLFGTKSTTVLTKLTAVCAIGFIVTCISLAIISSRQTKSIVDNVNMPQVAPVSVSQANNSTPQAQVPATAEPVPQGSANEVK